MRFHGSIILTVLGVIPILVYAAYWADRIYVRRPLDEYMVDWSVQLNKTIFGNFTYPLFSVRPVSELEAERRLDEFYYGQVFTPPEDYDRNDNDVGLDSFWGGSSIAGRWKGEYLIMPVERTKCFQGQGVSFGQGRWPGPRPGHWQWPEQSRLNVICENVNLEDFHANLHLDHGSLIIVKWCITVFVMCLLIAYVSMHSCGFGYAGRIRKALATSWRAAKFHSGKDFFVVQEIRRRRCQFADRCVATSCAILVPLSVFWVAESHRTKEIDNDILMNSELLPLLFSSVIFLILEWSRHRSDPVTLDCANIALSAMWVWTYATRRTLDIYVSTTSVIWAGRIAQGIAMGNAPLTLALHLGVSVVDVIIYTKHAAENNPVSSPSAYIVTQFVILSIFGGITMSFEMLMTSEAEALLEARRSDRAMILVKRLLTSMSDAVVYLDDGLKISEPSPKFASLILEPRSFALTGRHFVDFIDHSDRDRFAHYMAKESNICEPVMNSSIDSSPARMIHVNILDVHRRTFPVEIFVGRIRNLDGTTSCVVGVKEVLEDGREIIGAPEQALLSMPNINSIVQSDTSSCFSMCSDSQNTVESFGSAISSDSVRDKATELCTWLDEKEMPWFRFELSDLRQSPGLLRLVDYSLSFRHLFGLSVYKGSDISKWLRPSDVVQDFRDILVGNEESNSMMQVQFRPAHLERFNLFVNADIELVLFPKDETTECHDDDDEDNVDDDAIQVDDRFFVLAWLRNVQWTNKKLKNRRRESHLNRNHALVPIATCSRIGL